MKRISMTTLALTIALGAATLPQALAHGPGAAGPWGGQNMGPGMMGQGQMGQGMMSPGMMGAIGAMMPMMMRMHGQMMGGGMGGSAMTGGMGAMGPMGAIMDEFDADQDGTLTADELRAGLTAQLGEYDADGDGTLSLSEFEALHAAMVRPAMVDRFQALDEDGDGQVTGEEMTAPADRFARMQKMREAMQAQMPAGGRPGQPGTMMNGDGSMMGDN